MKFPTNIAPAVPSEYAAQTAQTAAYKAKEKKIEPKLAWPSVFLFIAACYLASRR